MKQTIKLLMLSFMMMITHFADAQCDPPTSLNHSYNNAVSTFTWDAVAGADDYTVEFKYPGYSWQNLEFAETTPTNSLIVNDIYQSATFEWRVICNCGLAGTSISTVSTLTIPCPQPQTLNVTNLDVTSATINWSPATGMNTMISDFVASYRAIGTSTWISLGHTFDFFKNITGLQPATTYEYCVMQTCPMFNSPTIMGQFTTLPSCYAPTGLINDNTSATQARLNWNASANAVNYTVEYKPSTSSTWLSLSPTNSTNITIIGLAASTLYDWRVTTDCNGNMSPYANAQFTTSGTNGCIVPTGLYATSVGNTSAVLNCLPVPGAIGYQVQWKKLSSTSWSNFSSTSPIGIAINSLSMNTAYEFRMRTRCGASTWSPYSSSVVFNTLNCVSSGINNNEWIDYFNIGSLYKSSGKEIGGYALRNQTVNLEIGSTRTGTISAGISGTINQQNFAVYIDFNRNGSYGDLGEKVASGSFTNTINNTYSLIIPTTATPGTAGMRVVLRRSNNGLASPCLTGFLGETEDFTVILIAPPPLRMAEKLDVEEEIQANPNPSNGQFTIQMSNEHEAIYFEVMNLNGSLVQKNRLNEISTFAIDLLNMPTGIYLLRVKDKTGKIHMKKLVKN